MLVVNAASRVMNPDLPAAIVAAAFADDPAHADAEYGSDACVMEGRYEVPAQPNVTYTAFVDPSGGSNDSMTLTIGHEHKGRVIVDVVRERRAPFDPDETVREFADALRPYRVSAVFGDKYAGEWPRERFRSRGISYRPADYTKSELYQALLPRLNACTIELLDNERMVKQLCALERRTSRGGKDSIDHPPGQGHKDDVINSVAGVAHYVMRGREPAVAGISMREYEQLQGRNRPGGVQEELARCAQADRERGAAGEQDRFLNSNHGYLAEQDRVGRPWLKR